MSSLSNRPEKRSTVFARSAACEVEELARRSVTENCSYCYYFRRVSFRFHDSVLVVEGQVPSFYLKQVLQTLLAGVDGIDEIDNRVDVVNSRGVSSVRASNPSVSRLPIAPVQ